MMGGLRKALDYTDIDPQIAAMRAEKKSIALIAAVLGIGQTTVSKRIAKLNIPKPETIRKKAQPITYNPPAAYIKSFCSLLKLLRVAKDKTQEPSPVVVAGVLHSLNKGKMAL